MEQFDITFRLALVVGVILYLVVIFFLLKKRKLSVQYSIIWLFSGFALLVFALVPYVVLVLGDILHIVNPVNFVFLAAIGFMLLILLSLSASVSQLTEKNKTLTQNAAFLERRIRELEQQMQAHKP